MDVLRGLYSWVDTTPGAWAFIASMVAITIGVRLTGTRRTLVQTRRDGMIVKEEIHPETEGTAQTRLGHFAGNLLKVAAIVLWAIGTFSCASHVHF
jgi:hypothetical protein